MRRLREMAADAVRLPKDVVLDLPRVSICGDKEIYIENHKGLAEYTPERISVKMTDGLMHIMGSALRIIVLETDRMVVNGDFERVEYEKYGRKQKNVQKNL